MVLSTLLIFQLLLIASSLCQHDLKLVITDTELAFPGLYIQALYDNRDKIYLIGGNDYTNTHTTNPIMEYTVSNGNLEIIGQFNKTRGCAVLTRNGDIYYLGGARVLNNQLSPEIVKLETTDNFSHSSVVNEFPSEVHRNSIVMDAGENIYSFGGYGGQTKDTIMKYSIGTNTLQGVGRLPSPRSSTSSVLNSQTNIAYIFGGYSAEAGYIDDILEYDLTTGTISTLELKLKGRVSNTCSVWDGSNAYIIGGSGYGSKFSITRFKPSTKNATDFIFDSLHLAAVGCTYVKEMNRIYIFGGDGNSGLNRNIMYVELSDSQNPTTTTEIGTTSSTVITTETPSDKTDCSDKEDFSTVPDPYCCNTYYLCQNGQAFQYNCDYKLQYSPSLKNCLPEEMVQCGLTYGNWG